MNKATKINTKGHIEDISHPQTEKPKLPNKLAARVWHTIGTVMPRIHRALHGPELTPAVAELDHETRDLLDEIFAKIVDDNQLTMSIAQLNGRRIAYDKFQQFLSQNYSGQHEQDVEVWENYRQHLLNLRRPRSRSEWKNTTAHALYRLSLSHLPSPECFAIISVALQYRESEAILETIFHLQPIIDWRNLESANDHTIGLKTLVYTLLTLIDEGKVQTVLTRFNSRENPVRTGQDFQRLAHEIAKL